MGYGANPPRTTTTMLQNTGRRKETRAVRRGGNDFLYVRGSKAH